VHLLVKGNLILLIVDLSRASLMYTTKDKHEEKKENTVTMVDKKREYNIGSLQNESTKCLYQPRLNIRLNRNEFTDTEEMHNYLKNCIHEAAK
jgi:hypothetical protein